MQGVFATLLPNRIANGYSKLASYSVFREQGDPLTGSRFPYLINSSFRAVNPLTAGFRFAPPLRAEQAN